MLKRFKVINYKKFTKTLTLDFSQKEKSSFLSFNDLSILVSASNNEGKSSLAGALLDITDHLVDRRPYFNQDKYYLSLESNLDYATFEYDLLLNQKNIKYIYKKNNDKKLLLEEIYLDDSLIFSFDYQTDKFFSKIEEIKKFDIKKRTHNISILKYLHNNDLFTNTSNIINDIIDYANSMIGLKANYQEREIFEISKFLGNNLLVDDFKNFLNKLGVQEEITTINNVYGNEVGIVKGKTIAPFTNIASDSLKTLMGFYHYYYQVLKKNNYRFVVCDNIYHKIDCVLLNKLIDLLYQDVNFESVIFIPQDFISKLEVSSYQTYLLEEGMIKDLK